MPETGRGNTGKRLLFRITLLAVVLVLGSSSVFAALEVLDVLHAFDFRSLKFENGNARIAFDGSWVPFFQKLNFDNNLFNPTGTDPVSGVPYGGTCQPTTWAGVLEHGLYEIDNNPMGAVGFQTTRNWTLVACDRDGDGDYDNDDKALLPPYLGDGTWTPYNPPNGTCVPQTNPASDNICAKLQQDVSFPCSTGNCASEIVTRVYVNLDRNCNGTPDVAIPPGGLCLYWEAETPDCVNGSANDYCLVDPADPSLGFLPPWGGNYQGRVNTGGGDKTINFNISYVPLGVTLASFTAICQAETPVVTWETVSEVNTAGFNVWRSNSSGAPELQLNSSMIPAHPGSTQGYSYSFTDTTAQPGATYYYWLEDIDVNGMTTLHGPISAMCSGPTAVTVSSLEASGSDRTATLGTWLIVLVSGIALTGMLSRRVKRT